MTSFNRVLLLALLYLAVVTTAVPVLEGNEVAQHGGLEARKPPVKTRPAPARPKPRPRPAPRPIPTKKPVIIKKPAPVPAPPRKPVPVPPHKPVPVPHKPVPVPPHKPVPVPPHQPVPVPPHQPAPPKKPVPTKSGAHATTTGGHPLPTTAPHGGNTTAPHGASCPLPNKHAKPTKPRALLEYVSSFFLTKRANPEFVGWHGTNSATAEVWHNAGYLKKPWSWMDVIGQRRTGGSGADQELGSGVYVTDSLTTAQGFADINAGQSHNSGTTPVLCAIFAMDSDHWRGNTAKAWLPNNIIGDAADEVRHEQLEATRVQWLRRVYPTVSPSNVIRFAPLDRGRGHPPGQLLIPASRTNEFSAICVPAAGGRLPRGAPAGDIDYDHARTAWHILDQPCV